MATQSSPVTEKGNPDLRRDIRSEVSWPVVVQVGNRIFLCQTVNVSARGTKVRPHERLSEGTVAQLHFHPPAKEPLDVPAIMWRNDPDGMAFFFIGDSRPKLSLGLPS